MIKTAADDWVVGPSNVPFSGPVGPGASMEASESAAYAIAEKPNKTAPQKLLRFRKFTIFSYRRKF